jgi:hypothetical protein
MVVLELLVLELDRQMQLLADDQGVLGRFLLRFQSANQFALIVDCFDQ